MQRYSEGPSLADRLKGRWPEALQKLGIDRRHLVNRHGPCPTCGGSDRFRFDNKEGSGSFFCSSCGPGKGIRLAMNFTGRPFRDVATELEKLLPELGPARMSSPRAPTDFNRLEEVWREARPRPGENAMGKFLLQRCGVAAIPDVLRFHPRLFHKKSAQHHPAMLAKVQAADGSSCQIHRTWLSPDGGKADVDPVRASMRGTIPRGSAVRLFPVAGTSIGIAEGIETAFAAASLFDLPVWSVLNVGGFKGWRPPAGVEEVVIFADADANGVGQTGAYALAAELALEPCRVRVVIPPSLGTDWRDVWSESK